MKQTLNNIDTPSLILLLCWLVFLIGAIFVYLKKPKLTPWFLFAAAVSIAAAFALFSPCLFTWDEQFHALVGKNLSRDPLTPMLFPRHPVPSPPIHWIDASIWLHKQPLFTWQIALSIKLFGTSAFAVRLPSVIFHGFLVLAIFRIGTLVFNRKTGFIAALIVLHSTFLLGLISGRVGTDHNDYIFLCYITFSCWAWFEWDFSKKRKWLYWIGIFAGCAILTKWLVGLLVFFGWALVILSRLKKENFWSATKSLLLSFGITIVVALPWQIYTFIQFPEEAKREMEYNTQHIFHAVEDHSGDYTYHFMQLKELYFNSPEFLLLVFIGIFFLFFRPVEKRYKIFILASIAVIYLFFTIVKTKMPGFTAPAFGFIALLMAFGIAETTNLIRNKWIRTATLTLVLAVVINWMLKPYPTLNKFGFGENNGEASYREMILRSHDFMLKEGSDSEKRVVFGANFAEFANISWMFFNDETAYPSLPSDEQIDELTNQGYSIVLIAPNDSIFNDLKGKEKQNEKLKILYFKR